MCSKFKARSLTLALDAVYRSILKEFWVDWSWQVEQRLDTKLISCMFPILK
jgi:hypothetical protein